MVSFIEKKIFSGLHKNTSAPYILMLLCGYGIVVSVYTGLFFDTASMATRIAASVVMIIGYILLERSPFDRSVLAFLTPTLLLTKILVGSLYFEGDFLVYTYFTGVALISLTYLKPKGVALYTAVIGAVMAAFLFAFNRNLLGPSFTMVQNYLSFVASVSLNILIYIFGKSYAQTLSDMAKARSEASQAALAKSNFLASMSHEIRTPMNAITGMAECLLRGDLSDESRSHAQDIKHAAGNLLSIINDLLDFSKIEAGKLEIIPAKYLLSSLVSDVVTIIKMRLEGKPIRFYINIDSRIPASLIGDEVRVRQILINLLANAVKYTEKGRIGFSIAQEKRADGIVWLKIIVSDTGYGIKPQGMEKLFNDFVRLDTKKNRALEGTGLGLPIVKRLCAAMGGNVSVASEYGKGSSFSVQIPQKIGSEEPFAAVSNPEGMNVLVFERRASYAKSACWSLGNMGVSHFWASDSGAFAEALLREQWSFVVSGYGLHGEIEAAMDRPDESFHGGKKPPVALMVEWGVKPNVPNARFLPIPAHSLSIANALAGRADHRDGFEASGAIQHVFPKARLLVVDDISINLRVAQGLLAPYKAAVDTCASGQEAVEMAMRRDYDIIFMDHMMPEMDGIEAAALIRAWEKKSGGEGEGGGARGAVPIVALTANAVSGMRELFVEKGFSDFLAKPVDVSKLAEILDRWIPMEKRERNKDAGSAAASGPSPGRPLQAIPGIDAEKAIERIGIGPAEYMGLLSSLRMEAEKRLPALLAMPSPETLPELAGHAHALKGMCASLGAHEISEGAAALEAAAKAGDLALVEERLSGFAESLAQMAENIGAALGADGAREGASVGKGAAEEAPQEAER